MDITKRDSKMLKGIAILAMLMLHLFCRRDNLPYTPLLWIGDTPLIYYFGLFGVRGDLLLCQRLCPLHAVLQNRAAASLEASLSFFDPVLGDCGSILGDWHIHRRFCDSRQCKGISAELPDH